MKRRQWCWRETSNASGQSIVSVLQSPLVSCPLDFCGLQFCFQSNVPLKKKTKGDTRGFIREKEEQSAQLVTWTRKKKKSVYNMSNAIALLFFLPPNASPKALASVVCVPPHLVRRHRIQHLEPFSPSCYHNDVLRFCWLYYQKNSSPSSPPLHLESIPASRSRPDFEKRGMDLKGCKS